MKRQSTALISCLAALCIVALMLSACGSGQRQASSSASPNPAAIASSASSSAAPSNSSSGSNSTSLVDKARSLNGVSSVVPSSRPDVASEDALRAQLNIEEYVHPELDHGDKSAPYQKYIVLHDTEGSADGHGVIDGWLNDGRFIASHFIINKDGSIVQAVPIDRIGHHAGYGNTGHNEQYGVTDESRDDMRGAKPIGDWASDYGMNSHSVGIEIVHEGNDEYPEAQLAALDGLIAYIDAHYDFESTIIDHKMWRSGNSDTSDAFSGYLANYRDHRTHV